MWKGASLPPPTSIMVSHPRVPQKANRGTQGFAEVGAVGVVAQAQNCNGGVPERVEDEKMASLDCSGLPEGRPMRGIRPPAFVLV